MESGMKPPRRTTSIATHLFACFTSRSSSSSSMKISSKSVPSPGRTDRFREPAAGPASATSSLSRRLRSNNGSTKKGQGSPMFPGGATKKRGSVLENPEPSSPKVSCIGQVRVKTRRKKKRRRKLSHAKSQRSGDGEASFRGFEKYGGGKDNGNRKWVHLPSILCCEAFREFGSDPSCFLLPRRPSTGKDGNKRRGIESQIREENERDEEEAPMEESSWRRRGFGTGEIEIRDFENGEIFMEGGKSEEGTVGVCVPPKNALLLMRCRSDPLKMSALTTRLCESSFSGNQRECSDEDDDNDESEDVKEEEKDEELGERRRNEEIELNLENLDEQRLGQESVPGETIEGKHQTSEEEATVVEMEEEAGTEETLRRTVSESSGIEEEEVQDKTEENLMTILQLQGDPVSETLLDPGISGSEEDDGSAPFRKEEPKDGGRNCSSVQSEQMEDRQVGDPSAESGADEAEGRESTERASSPGKQETEARFTRSDPEQERPTHNGGGGLADSLLLQMLREPKLSMEVSRETWVRSTDFIGRQRRLPPANPTDGCDDDEPRKRKSTGSRPSWSRQIQPPRSSCSLPMSAAAAGASMAAVIGEKIAMP